MGAIRDVLDNQRTVQVARDRAMATTVVPQHPVTSYQPINGIGALAAQPATQRPVYNTYASYQSTQPHRGNYMPADQIAALKAKEQAALNASAAQANLQRQGMKQTVAAPQGIAGLPR